MSTFKQLCRQYQNDIHDARSAIVFGVFYDNLEIIIGAREYLAECHNQLTEGLELATRWKQTASLGWFKADCEHLIGVCDRAISYQSPRYY